MTIGERIVILRENKGWKQKELADKVDINVSVMNRIEKGTRPLTDSEIVKIASVFEVSTDYLLGKSNRHSDNSSDSIPDKAEGSETYYDSLAEINNLIKQYGIEQMGFFDIEKWKNLSPEDVDEIRRHFEWVAQKAKERNEEKD
ncbi:helix-turn-helix domain-containing protein [Peribacillus asahii]|uniref:helix-turn-helix domain-containing protein n=1 Tax=Peribacillus asahii TaxID=228899 RepID=UPI003807BBA2